MLRQEAAILSKTWRKIQIGRLGFSKEGQKWWFVDGGLLVLLFFFFLLSLPCQEEGTKISNKKMEK